MIDDKCKKRASELVKKAKEKGLIMTYHEFCKTKEAEENKLTDEEIIFYTSQDKEEIKNEKI